MRGSLFIPVVGISILASTFSYAILDTNGNGLSDFWERQFNEGELFPESFDPQADPDGDGWTNAQEAVAGTNPFDPNPPDGLVRPTIALVPALWSEPDEYDDVYLIYPESVTVSWPTLPGKKYTLLVSPDLSPESWLPVGDPFVASGGEATYGIETSESDRLFWRVTVADTDSDYDGLTDHEEFLAGTNPYLADSDGDTISDWVELNAGLNPLDQDTDGDGIPDLLDSDPLVSAFAFADADGDGIADADDSEPNVPRGPAPSMISENASGNPVTNFIKDETVRLVITVANPGGDVPSAADLTLYANGTEETATIAALGAPGASSQRFLLTWVAKTAANYPTLTLQHLTLRFRDSDQATSWINLARIDVAEWEGKIIALPFVSDETFFGFHVSTHLNGLKRKQHFVSRNSGSNSVYRGPKMMSLVNGSGATSEMQLGDHAIPFLRVSVAENGTPSVLQQSDYADIATGMEVDYLLNNGSEKSLQFTLSQAGINATLAPGESQVHKANIANVVFPYTAFTTIKYLDGTEWKPYFSGTWPVATIARADSRTLCQ